MPEESKQDECGEAYVVPPPGLDEGIDKASLQKNRVMTAEPGSVRPGSPRYWHMARGSNAQHIQPWQSGPWRHRPPETPCQRSTTVLRHTMGLGTFSFSSAYVNRSFLRRLSTIPRISGRMLREPRSVMKSQSAVFYLHWDECFIGCPEEQCVIDDVGPASTAVCGSILVKLGAQEAFRPGQTC